MAVRYCGECDYFERDEECKKGWCSKIKKVVWDSDYVPEDEEDCEYYEGE